jgi:hypothetical protein
MSSADPLRDSVSALLDAAQAFHRAAWNRGSHRAAPESLASLQEALQVLSAGWYVLAADAVRTLERNRAFDGDLSRAQEVRLIGALQDVAAAFACSARACREAGSTITPVIAGQAPIDWAGAGPSEDGRRWFSTRRPPTEQVA